MMRSNHVLTSVALLALGSALTMQAQVTDLGTYPGGTWAEMWAINDLGLAVGIGNNAEELAADGGISARSTGIGVVRPWHTGRRDGCLHRDVYGCCEQWSHRGPLANAGAIRTCVRLDQAGRNG
jgi:hypothetical protein